MGSPHGDSAVATRTGHATGRISHSGVHTCAKEARLTTTQHVAGLVTWVDGDVDQLDPLALLARELGGRVAGVWSAGTGLGLSSSAVTVDGDHAVIVLEEAWDEAPRLWPTEAVLGHRLDRPFGRRARHMTPMLTEPVRELLGRRLVGTSAKGRGHGRVVVELALAGHGHDLLRGRRRPAASPPAAA
jgi:hypothetical protein